MHLICEGCFVWCGNGNKIEYQKGIDFKITQSLEQTSCGCINWLGTLIFPWCSRTVNMASDHGANVLGVFGYLHFTKFHTVRRHPVLRRLPTFTSVLHPTALPMLQVEPNGSSPLNGRSHSDHRSSERRGSHCKVSIISTRNRLEEVYRVLWDDRVLEPTEDR